MGMILRKLAALVSGRKEKTCNICRWTGAALEPMRTPTYTRENAVCPSCGSHERHRALIKYIDAYVDLDDSYVLDIAPVASFRKYFNDEEALYVSMNLSAPAMIKGDLLDTPFSGESFDCIICYHVLEHIKDDLRAMREMRRLLKPTGIAFIQVPFDPGSEQTVEYDSPDSQCHGHVRSHYGMDFHDRLKTAGFTIEAQDLGKFFQKRVQAIHGFDRESGITFLCRK